MHERKQKAVWQQEHLTAATLPSLNSQMPSDAVVAFVDFIKQHHLFSEEKFVVDIGCGKGRNAVYLAQQGLQVHAFDYIEYALGQASMHATKEQVDRRIRFACMNMDEQWHFPDNYFDFALDCYSSIDVETKEGREVCKREMFRTLKSGGYALVCVVAADDNIESALIKQHPAAEPNSVIWPENGKFQKNYDRDELISFYAEFRIVELREQKKKATKLGREFIATNYWLLLEKAV